MSDVIRLKLHQYIHVLDNNTNVPVCRVGPMVFTRKDHEKVLFSPKQCISIPPRCYCRIRNPCVLNAQGEPEEDENGQVKLRVGDEEIRFEQEPFPLMPGEILVGDEKEAIKKLAVIPKNTALKLRCVRNFKDEAGKARNAGDEWLFEGPNTYVPRVEVEVSDTIKAHVIKSNNALRLRARRSFTDRGGVNRDVGEEWLVRTEGAYLPGVEEEVVGTVEALVLTDKEAIHLEALRTETDAQGRKRLAGEQWLVTNKDVAAYIPDVHEKLLQKVKVTTLNKRQYCVVVDPVDASVSRRCDVARPRSSSTRARSSATGSRTSPSWATTRRCSSARSKDSPTTSPRSRARLARSG